MNIQNVLQGIKYPQFQVKKEYLHILTWLLIFLVSPQLLRTVDLTAAPLDPGVLSILIVAVLAVLLFQAGRAQAYARWTGADLSAITA